MTLPCQCDGPGYCERFSQDMNPYRWKLCQTREDYRSRWDQNVEHYKCEHFGAYTNESRLCQSCKGKVKIKIFDCAIHGKCTFSKCFADGSIACCKGCKDFKCVQCKFDKNGKCIHCGYVLEKRPHIPEADTIVRECHDPVTEMPLLYSRDGNPLYLKNLFSSQYGTSIFFIGSGPSLLKQNLDLLKEKHITTFAVNNVAAKLVKPNLWCCVDEPKAFHNVIWDDPTIMKFIPSNKSGKHFYRVIGGKPFQNSNCPAMRTPNTYVFNLKGHFDHKTFFTENEVSWGCEKGVEDSLGIKAGRSVLLPSFRLMHYLGFKRIYLLGCDFNMQHDPKGKGKGLTYAFSQYKHAGGCKTNNDCYSIMDKRLAALRPLLEEDGVKVYNCTPNSKMTAFDFMDYEEAIEKERFKEKVFTNNMYV